MLNDNIYYLFSPSIRLSWSMFLKLSLDNSSLIFYLCFSNASKWSFDFLNLASLKALKSLWVFSFSLNLFPITSKSVAVWLSNFTLQVSRSDTRLKSSFVSALFAVNSFLSFDFAILTLKNWMSYSNVKILGSLGILVFKTSSSLVLSSTSSVSLIPDRHPRKLSNLWLGWSCK